jgi:hypothetical protein
MLDDVTLTVCSYRTGLPVYTRRILLPDCLLIVYRCTRNALALALHFSHAQEQPLLQLPPTNMTVRLSACSLTIRS